MTFISSGSKLWQLLHATVKLTMQGDKKKQHKEVMRQQYFEIKFSYLTSVVRNIAVFFFFVLLKSFVSFAGFWQAISAISQEYDRITGLNELTQFLS